MEKLLDKVNSPADLKQLPIESLPQLSEEIREMLISVLSETGGHVASNLGVVELSVALHYVLDSPRDKIIWDVGHQCYIHKMLTGRKDKLKTIRQFKGLAGFAKVSESEHDVYGAGHASTAISAALGLAVSRELSAAEHEIVAVIGDGSLTGGMAFEGLNNLGNSGHKMLVILNDNSMSISKNVGAFSEYLTDMISDQTYNKVKDLIWELTGRVKGGSHIRDVIGKIDNSVKNMLVPGIIFEKLGLRYFGPIDGHDVAGLVKVLGQLKTLSGPRLLHIRTQKGKGYKPAEEDACRFHGLGKFDKITGKSNKSSGVSYTKVFGDTTVQLAEKDEDIVVITAAMPSGTGLTRFAEKFPDRFFDVGIAEQHAAVFAAGMARGGKKPIVAVYSTFLQRAYDSIVHDISLQQLPVIFALDRAGLVGDDGPTHHGCFDLSYLRAIPEITICAPRDGTELRQLLTQAAVNFAGPIAIRYPRSNIPEKELEDREMFDWGSWEKLTDGQEVAILTVGSMVTSSLEAAKLLHQRGLEVAVYNCRFVKPLDRIMLEQIVQQYTKIVTVEEGALIGGFGSGINDWFADTGHDNLQLYRMGIPDTFIEHGDRSILLEMLALHPQGIAGAVESFVRSEGKRTLVIKPEQPVQPVGTVSRSEKIQMVAKEKQ